LSSRQNGLELHLPSSWDYRLEVHLWAWTTFINVCIYLTHIHLLSNGCDGSHVLWWLITTVLGMQEPVTGIKG
jgi:hypothetical protein